MLFVPMLDNYAVELQFTIASEFIYCMRITIYHCIGIYLKESRNPCQIRIFSHRFITTFVVMY